MGLLSNIERIGAPWRALMADLVLSRPTIIQFLQAKAPWVEVLKIEVARQN